ncbi:MAG: branched-chain amino acid ABC transporter permease [Armatimonadetes bacterium]|nr:branched-chain amino acid ABC transporter permease [Armatimonadota bacterium]
MTTAVAAIDFELLGRIFPRVLVDGILLGFVYSLIALGYTMVYGVLEFINFAHSEIFMVGAFIGAEVLLILQAARVLAASPPLLSLLASVLAAGVIAGLLAVTIERVAYRPLRGAPRLVPLISAIGVSFFLQDLVRMIWALHRNAFYLTYPPIEVFNQRFPAGAYALWGGAAAVAIAAIGWLMRRAGRGVARARFESLSMLPKYTSIALGIVSVGLLILDPNRVLTVPVKSLVVIGASLLVLSVLVYVVNQTKLGMAIRAVAEDQATASLMGVNVNQIISVTFLIGGLMGGIAGALFGLQFGTVNPYSGFIPGLKAFTAAVLGGIGNIPGAMLGGLVLGVLEALAGSYLSLISGGAFGAEYKDIFAFSVLILILIFRPRGLLGEVVREKL